MAALINVLPLPHPLQVDPEAIRRNQQRTNLNFDVIKALDWIAAGSGISVSVSSGVVTISQGAGAVTGSATANQVTYWSGTSVLTGDAGYTFTPQSGSGTDGTLTLANSQNNSGADSIFNIQVGGTTAGDPFIQYTIPSGTSWVTGPDNSASDAFLIGEGSALGTTTDFQIAVGGAVSIPRGNFDVTRAFAAGTVSATVRNTSATASSDAFIVIQSANGEAALRLDNGTQWDMHISSTSLRFNQAGGGSSVTFSTVGSGTFLGAGTNGTTIAATSTAVGSSAHAILSLANSNSSSADPKIQLTTPAGTWAFGVDNDNSDTLTAGFNGSLGTSTRFILTPTFGGLSIGTTVSLADPTVNNLGFSGAWNNNSANANILAHFENLASTGTSDNMFIQIKTTSGSSGVKYRRGSNLEWLAYIDVGDSDAYKIKYDNSASAVEGVADATAMYFKIDTSGNVSVPHGDLDVTRSTSGATVLFTTSNTSNTASAKARHLIQVAGTTADDAYSTWAISGGAAASLGIDNSDSSDRATFAYSATLGTTDVWTTEGTIFTVVLPATFSDNITTTAGKNIILPTSTGTKIGTAANQLLGFWGATPVDQPSFIADPTGGATQDAESRTAIAAILDLLIETGFMAAA